MIFESCSLLAHLSPWQLADFRRIEVPKGLGSDFRRIISSTSPCMVFERENTSEWSLLKQCSDGLCVIDDPLIEFTSIPEFVSTPNHRRRVTAISDRLCCLCGSRAIPIPRFIRMIGSSFRSIESRVSVLEISSSIEVIEGFLGVRNLEIVRFASGSELRKISGFCACESLISVEIPSTVEIIDGFNHCRSLQIVRFEAESRIREIDGFGDCGSLPEIEIPASTEIVRGFCHCKSIERIVFMGLSAVREIHGFECCDSLCEIEMPESVQIVEGFEGCGRLRSITFPTRSHFHVLTGFFLCPSLSKINVPRSIQRIQLKQSDIPAHIIFDAGTIISDLSVVNCKEKQRRFLDYVESDLAQTRRCVNMSRPYRRSPSNLTHEEPRLGMKWW
jgi:hypothetical protein